MNHLEAIDAGLSSSQPYNEIARKVFLVYPTTAFIGNEEVQYEIYNRIAKQFHIPIHTIQACGSAKLGISIHKNSPFVPGQSDLDLAIIDQDLFAKYVDIGVQTSKSYSDGTVFDVRSGQSTQGDYMKYLARGIFRPDLMPRGQKRAEWNNFFSLLSSDFNAHFSSISAAVYISQNCFESKQRSCIRNRANLGTL